MVFLKTNKKLTNNENTKTITTWHIH